MVFDVFLQLDKCVIKNMCMLSLDKLGFLFSSVNAKGKLWLLLTILTFLSIDTYANYTVVGCVSDDTGYLYTGQSGVNSPRGYGPAYEPNPVVTSGQIGTGNYCRPTTLGNCVIRTKSRCSECTGPYDYMAGYGTDYYYEQSGKLVGYVMCPVDDYAGLLLVLVGGTGVYFLRRRKLAITFC